MPDERGGIGHQRQSASSNPEATTMSQKPKDSDDRMWGGRFQEPTDAFVQAFTASVDFDRRLAKVDIEGSLAHARMLQRIGVLDEDERLSIERGLAQISSEIARGDFPWSVELEDVHMNIEARLTQLIGDAGKKLHTGRSRNDQIATDIRLYLREEIDFLRAEIRRLQHGLLDLGPEGGAQRRDLRLGQLEAVQIGRQRRAVGSLAVPRPVALEALGETALGDGEGIRAAAGGAGVRPQVGEHGDAILALVLGDLRRHRRRHRRKVGEALPPARVGLPQAAATLALGVREGQ